MNHNGSNLASRENASLDSTAFANDPRLDPDDPDFDPEAEQAMCDFCDAQDREWDEHDAQQAYSEGDRPC